MRVLKNGLSDVLSFSLLIVKLVKAMISTKNCRMMKNDDSCKMAFVMTVSIVRKFDENTDRWNMSLILERNTPRQSM